jgi:predicted esterase
MKSVLVHALAAAVVIAGFSALTGCNGARDTALNAVNNGPKGFMHKQLVRGNRTRTYGLFVPSSYNASTKYPVIIFLHGMGEGGNDAKSNLRVGLAPFVADADRSGGFPFICVFPQSESGGWDENSEAATDVIACIDDVAKNYSIDQDRVSLTGLSTGGYGTWAIGAKYKERFAALVPMGSNSSAEKYADRLIDMPIWSFHNSGDPFAAAWNDSTMVAKLKSLGNKNATYTEYPAAGHNCWETAYGDGQIFSWLQSQRRRGTAAAPAAIRSTSSAAPAAKPVPVTPVSAAPAKSTPSQQGSTGTSALVPTPY